MAGIDDWQEISPDRHRDWIGQRDEAFQAFFPLGSKTAKAGKPERVIFSLYSRGLATSRDAYVYNFSREGCAENARRMVADYMGAMQLREERPDYTVDDVVKENSRHVRWDRELKNNMRRHRAVTYSPDNVWATQYRPFVKQHCYVEYALVNNKYQQDSIFPQPVAGQPATRAENRVICVPGVGANKPFSVLVSDRMPDLHFVGFGQCFPRYRYVYSPTLGEPAERDDSELFATELERVDNITDAALVAFQDRYGEADVRKDTIFDYVYGMLHAPTYRDRFANDLTRDLPRIPFASDFSAFAEAGRALATLHLGYETCAEHPLEIVAARSGRLQSRHFRLGDRPMRFQDADRAVLVVNEHVRLARIPAAAHGYVVNGRTPLEWFIDRYRVTRDRESGIVNDPNGWFSKPEDLVTAIQRIVHVSVETVRIVAGLPEPSRSLPVMTAAGRHDCPRPAEPRDGGLSGEHRLSRYAEVDRPHDGVGVVGRLMLDRVRVAVNRPPLPRRFDASRCHRRRAVAVAVLLGKRSEVEPALTALDRPHLRHGPARRRDCAFHAGCGRRGFQTRSACIRQ